MMGYGPEEENTVVELTYNYGVESYDKGNAYGQVQSDSHSDRCRYYCMDSSVLYVYTGTLLFTQSQVLVVREMFPWPPGCSHLPGVVAILNARLPSGRMMCTRQRRQCDRLAARSRGSRVPSLG